MPPREPTLRLPHWKLPIYVVFLAGGVLLLALSLTRGSLASGPRQAFFGLATTLLIVSLVELVPELAAWVNERSRRESFRRCFGNASFGRPVKLVFIFRESSRETPRPTKDMRGPGERRDYGVYSWLAFQDVRAGINVANTISQITGHEVAVVQDKDVEEQSQWDSTMISLGLGENHFTEALGQDPEPSLFGIEWITTEKGKRKASFVLTPPCPDHPDENKDLALVARIVPRARERQRGCVWFVCGGRLAAGTSAAGHFLAERWPEILDLYAKNGRDLDKHSLALVIEHKRDIRRHEFDHSAAIFELDGKPVLRWSPS